MDSLWTLLKEVRPYLWLVIGGVLATAGTVAADLSIPRLTQYAIDQGITPGNLNVVITSALIMIVVALLSALFGVVTGVFGARASQGLAYDLRNKLFSHIQKLSYGNLDRLQTGQLMIRVTSDVDMIRMFIVMSMRMLTRAPLMIIGSLTLIYLTEPRLALLMLVLMPLELAVVIFFATKARPLFKTVQEKLSELNTVLQENLAGVRVIKAFVRGHFEIDRFRQRNDDYYRASLNVGRLIAFAFPLLFLIVNLSTLAVLWFGGRQVIAGSLSIGQLTAFNNYVLTTMFPLLMLSMMITFVSSASASAERICEILDTKAVLQEPQDGQAAPDMTGRVVFDHVTFRYDGSGSEKVLDDVSFVAEPGEKVALVGATGSGKSTLVNLIPRFYDVTDGRVTIDGVDVRDMSFSDLRRRIGVVPQSTLLFQGTVRQNIAYGRPEATQEEVEAAARAAQAHDFIMEMSEGYDSHIEARGTNLSGGQRQRIAIARALAMNPRILILDDSTSSVDMDTEYHIQQALETAMAGRTSLIIAQRISSVLHADKIIVLERGRIAAVGTHRELLELSPIYQEIYRSQLSDDGAMAGPVPDISGDGEGHRSGVIDR